MKDNVFDKIEKGPLIGKRHIQFALLFMALAIGYTQRTVLNVGIVAMTSNGTSPNPDIPVYDWNYKSTVLSSFYWGYVTLQPFAGEIVKNYGAKWPILIAMLATSSVCVLLPWVASLLGGYGVIGCRVLQGACQGLLYPTTNTILGKWAPLNERSRMSTMAFSGPPVGTVVSSYLTGVIASSWVGWPISFYIFGSLGYVWTILWWWQAVDSPLIHSTITPEEKAYIQESLSKTSSLKAPKTPWKAIFVSIPVWATIVGLLGDNFGTVLLLTEMPTYMDKVLQLPMKLNGLFSALPYLSNCLLMNVQGALSDYIINHGFISRANSRRLFCSVSLFLPSIAILVLRFIPKEEKALSVAMLFTAISLSSASYCGHIVNITDISPNFAGVIMGVANGMGNTMSILGPLLVQVIVTDESDIWLWRIIFMLYAAGCLTANFFFVIFMSAEVQPWNGGVAEKEKTQEDIKEIVTIRKSK